MDEDEQDILDLEVDMEGRRKKGLWKAAIAILIIAFILLIAIGLIPYWMVSSYGGW